MATSSLVLELFVGALDGKTICSNYLQHFQSGNDGVVVIDVLLIRHHPFTQGKNADVAF